MGLRRFLAVLKEAGDFYEVPWRCSPEYQIAGHIRRSCDRCGPALSFPVNGTSFPVIGGLYGTKERVKRIFDEDYGDTYCGASDLEVVRQYSECATVEEGRHLFGGNVAFEVRAKCQEVIKIGSEVDLNEFPICVHNEFDAGHFITAGVNVVRWIDGKTHGLGIHRMNILSRRTISCLAPPNRRVGYPHYQSKNGIEMAVVIGAPPEVVLASQAKVNPRTEKYLVAANLMKPGKFQLTKCKTIDVWVPADAELVLECKSIPESLHDDTPFGEYPGTYSMRSNSWISKVQCITHRKDCLYQTILTGKLPQEDSNLCAIPYSSEIYRVASNFVEEVTDIAAFLGNNVFDTIVCIKKSSNSEIANLLHQLLGNKYLKSVTIMDHDLKATEEDWRFAFNTRYQPNRDTIITNLALGASLDPSSPLFQSTSKIGFDFTIPKGGTKQEEEANWMRHRVAEPYEKKTPTTNFWEE